MDLATIKDISTIAGVIIALIVYITNSINHYRKTVADNIFRLIDAVDLVINTALVREHVREMDLGVFKRDPNDESLNRKFFDLYYAMDKIALLHKAKAIPASVDTYLFSWISQQIQPHILPEERNDIWWTLAIEFIEEMKSLADDFDKKDRNDRINYFRGLNFYRGNQTTYR